MKLTWFGRTAFRIHIGGQILVVDAQAARADVDSSELVSAADLAVRLGEDVPAADPKGWKARARERLLEAGDEVRPVQLWSLGAGSLLIDADEDRPLALLTLPVPELGKWADRAVFVLAGADLAARASALVQQHAPALIALAGDDAELDAAFAILPERLDGTGLIALEPGLAVEV